jgi:hypothetical protein
VLKPLYSRLIYTLLTIPYLILFFFIVLLFVALSLVYLEHRRNRNRMDYVEEVDEERDFEDVLQVAENYVKMLREVPYTEKVGAKFDQEVCPVCHLQYTEGEVLRQVP